MTSRAFGTLPSGETVHAHTLSNASGASVEILSLGGIVRSLRVPDRGGRLDDVVLGFGSLGPYLSPHPYMGAIIGRIAGRVTGGVVVAGGREWPLACNEGGNHLHGGVRGFDKRLWKAQEVAGPGGAESLRLTYTSPDGEEGYPGTLEVAATYTLTAGNDLVFETEVRSDRPTPVSLTQHAYFNLSGEGSGDVLGHEVRIVADEYVPADASFTLSDRREPVAGTGADLNRQRRLADALPGIFKAHGDPYLLRPEGAGTPPSPTFAARVTDPATGRVVDVHTDETVLQFYTGVGLDGTLTGKSGRPYGRHAGLCLECEGYANASVAAGFGDIIVRPGIPQRRRTVYAFSAA